MIDLLNPLPPKPPPQDTALQAVFLRLNRARVVTPSRQHQNDEGGLSGKQASYMKGKENL